MARFAKKIDLPYGNPPARTIFPQKPIFPRKKDVFLLQMAGKQAKTEFLKMGEKIAATLAKSGMEFDQQYAAIEVAKLIMANSEYRQSDGGAQ